MTSGDSVPFADDLLPTFDVESRHRIEVAAPANVVYEEARRLDMSPSPLIRLLFRLRGMPGSALDAEGLSRIGFKPLVEDPPIGFALAIVGQFWTPTGRLVDFETSGFPDLQMPGFAKALWTFDITPGSATAVTLRTVTRVYCMDPSSRRWFRRYWTVIGPVSSLIRRKVLRLVKRSAEERYRRGAA